MFGAVVRSFIADLVRAVVRGLGRRLGRILGTRLGRRWFGMRNILLLDTKVRLCVYGKV